MSRRPPLTEAQRLEAVALFRAGMRPDDIADRMGRNRSSIYRALRRTEPIAFTAAPIPGARTKHSPETVARFVELHAAGRTVASIADELGIGHSTAENWSAGLNTRNRQRTGACHAGWWTVERTRALIRMKAEGVTREAICAAMGCTMHSVIEQWRRVRAHCKRLGLPVPSAVPGPRAESAVASGRYPVRSSASLPTSPGGCDTAGAPFSEGAR